jgi:hypothetical protein
MHTRPNHSCQTSRRSYLNCDSCLKETRVRTRYHIVQTVDWSSLSWNLERNQKLNKYWEASRHAAETSGRMQAGTETSRYSMGSGRNEHFIQTDDSGLSSVQTGWHVVRTDGTVDRWASGRDGSIVRMADMELKFLLTCRLWIVESLFTASLHLSDFVQTQNEDKILTEFTLNSCSSQCLGASIYRLGAQMSVRQNIPGHRLDGGHGPSGRTTVRQDFLKNSRRNLSCLRLSSERDGTSSWRSHVHCK